MRPVLPLVLVLSLAGGAGAAPAPAVKDKAGLFSPKAVEQAAEHIDAVQQKYGLALTIETLPALPKEEAKTPPPERSRWAATLARFKAPRRSREAVADEARTRAEASGREGVFVLICKDPRHVSVVLWPEEREADYPSWQREELRNHFARRLAADPDGVLLSAVDL